MRSEWFPSWKPRAAARVRLVCLPYGGGGASAFRGWQQALPDHIEVLAAQYPGHETRLREEALTSVEVLARALFAALRPLLDLPLAIYGHSLGALAGFELARLLARQGERAPERLFLAACGAPHTRKSLPLLHGLADGELRGALRAMGGTPAPVLESDEMMELFLPMLRADLTMSETWSCSADERLDVPFTIYAGRRDEAVEPARLAAWRELNTGDCEQVTFDGGHFFLKSHQAELLAHVARRIR